MENMETMSQTKKKIKMGPSFVDRRFFFFFFKKRSKKKSALPLRIIIFSSSHHEQHFNTDRPSYGRRSDSTFKTR